MSKLIDRLKLVFQPSQSQIGFRSTNAESKRPKIQLIVYIDDPISRAGEKALSVVDAVIVQASQPGYEKSVWGSWLTWGSEEELAEVEKAGADFVICPTNTTALPVSKKLGKVLRVETSTHDGLLRSVNRLPVDAVIVAEDPGSTTTLTWNRLLHIRRFADFFTKPILVFIAPNITKDSLQLLWEIGVSGIVVDIKKDTDITVLGTLRKIIDGLSYPSPRDREKLADVLPQAVSSNEKKEEPDEDDDDDD